MYKTEIPYYYLIIKYTPTYRPKPKEYIYVHSFEDARIYLNAQLLQSYKSNLSLCTGQESKTELVKSLFYNYKIFESTTDGFIQIPIIRDWTLEEWYNSLVKPNIYTPFLSRETKAYYPLKELQKMTSPSCKLPKYSYPIYIEQAHVSKHKQGRKHFSYSMAYENDWWSQLTFRTRAANSDPELQPYLRPRDKQIYTDYKHDQSHNQHNIGNNWKRHTHHRKQWAKRIDNPSYTKLSREIWKYNLEHEEKF